MSNNWMERADKVVMNTYGRQPLVLVKGEGCRVWDDTGKEYLDCVAGLAVVNLGHAHPEVAQAAAAQLTQLVHVSNIYYTTPMVELAEALVRLSFADRVFFANSGAEVNEGAIKLVRRYSRERFGAGRHRIICMENSFHGRTLGALSRHRPVQVLAGLRPPAAGFYLCALQRPGRGGQGRGRHRLRRDAGAHPGRRRGLPALARLFEGCAAVVRRQGPVADPG